MLTATVGSAPGQRSGPKWFRYSQKERKMWPASLGSTC